MCADYMVSSQQSGGLPSNHPHMRAGLCLGHRVASQVRRNTALSTAAGGYGSWVQHNRRGHRPPPLPPRERNSRIGSRPLLTWLGKSLVFSRGRDHADPASRPTWGRTGTRGSLLGNRLPHNGPSATSPSFHKPHQVVFWFQAPRSMPSFRPLPSANHGCRLSGATLSATPTSPQDTSSGITFCRTTIFRMWDKSHYAYPAGVYTSRRTVPLSFVHIGQQNIRFNCLDRHCIEFRCTMLFVADVSGQKGTKRISTRGTASRFVASPVPARHLASCEQTLVVGPLEDVDPRKVVRTFMITIDSRVWPTRVFWCCAPDKDHEGRRLIAIVSCKSGIQTIATLCCMYGSKVI